MIKPTSLLLLLLLNAIKLCAAPVIDKGPANLICLPGSCTANSVAIFWDKPKMYKDTKSYLVYINGKNAKKVNATNYLLTGLSPNHTYTVYVKAETLAGTLSAASKAIKIKTLKKSKIYDIRDFGARANGSINNAKAIQKAIDACNRGGTVLIPEGVFTTGAIYLKSDMTLLIKKGGALKASLNVNDYLPMALNRFEGWELQTYASLINVGKMDRSKSYTTHNVNIRGEGMIEGGGSVLANTMMKLSGIRSRGRLICIMNASDVNIEGLALENSHCWTLHYIYSKGITCNGLKIHSEIINGDGIDPDSSIDSYILNCSFSTGDDCIAIKSGKNPEGNIINRPTRNITIADCEFTRGLSVAIGSEMSGGVSDILIRDCKIGNLKEGVQIKSRKDRGGYVERVTVKNCTLKRIKIETTIAYNSDGAAAPKMPYYKDLKFIDLDMSGGKTNSIPIFIDGFPLKKNYTRNALFKNITLPEKSVVSINYANAITFKNVKTAKQEQPEYKITNSSNITK